MSTFYCEFYNLIATSPFDPIIPLLKVTEAEISVLWKLAMEDFHTCYSLHKGRYDFPLEISRRINASGKLERRAKYDHSYIREIVKSLESKKLVKTVKDPSESRMRVRVDLTFAGLLLYLRRSADKHRFKNAINHHSQLLPLSENWASLSENLGNEKVIDALNRAVENCYGLSKAKFRIRTLELEFEGFLRNEHLWKMEKETVKEKDMAVWKFLQNNEGTVLRNSYIAYLAVHNILQLSKRSRREAEKLLSTLKSERELAHLENREINARPLFRDDRLKEFFPKYADMKFFFTGMFVEKLLWHEKEINTKPEKYDFDVEFLFD